MSYRKKFLDWKDFENALEVMVARYKNTRSGIRQIVALSRGGLPIGVALSNRLGIPLTTLTWQTRDGQRKDVDKLKEILREEHQDRILFVDDVCDSGETIRQIKKYASRSRWCVWVAKNNEDVETSVVKLESKELESWIVFPWEEFK